MHIISQETGEIMQEKKGIIFDMDGTVWDSSENVAKDWTVKVHEAGFTDKTVTREDIQSAWM